MAKTFLDKGTSVRSQIANNFAEWLGKTGRFTAPYGIIVGLHPMKGGKGKARSVTFGVARISDINLLIFTPSYMILRDSRFGEAKCDDIIEVMDVLRVNYKLEI